MLVLQSLRGFGRGAVSILELLVLRVIVRISRVLGWYQVITIVGAPREFATGAVLLRSALACLPSESTHKTQQSLNGRQSRLKTMIGLPLELL